MLSPYTLKHTFSSSAHTRLRRKNNLPNNVSQFRPLSQTPNLYRGRGSNFPSHHGQALVLKKNSCKDKRERGKIPQLQEIRLLKCNVNCVYLCICLHWRLCLCIKQSHSRRVQLCNREAAYI